jgi:hypothetical protein
MNRPVAVAAANIDAVNAAHANVIQERKDRRDGTAAFAPAAAGFAGAGFGAGVEGAGESSLLIGVSRYLLNE